jgi:hypothetical protein
MAYGSNFFSEDSIDQVEKRSIISVFKDQTNDVVNVKRPVPFSRHNLYFTSWFRWFFEALHVFFANQTLFTDVEGYFCQQTILLSQNSL